MSALRWVSVLALGALFGCEAEIPDGRFLCDPGRTDGCPSGQTCCPDEPLDGFGGRCRSVCEPAADGGLDGGLDAGPLDAGPVDSGLIDGGIDGGPSDAGPSDAGIVDTRPIALAAGGAHSCLVRGDGQVLCWGDDRQGQLGQGRPMMRSTVPVSVSGLMPGVVEVAASVAATCARHPAGVQCWGSNTVPWAAVDGPLGDSRFSESAEPIAARISDTPSRIVMGAYHACAIVGAERRLECWGDNRNGQLGTGDRVSHGDPVRVPRLSGVTDLCAGYSHTCAVADGTAHCWGMDREGQVGDGPAASTDVLSPTAIAGLSDVQKLSCGAFHSCAITGSGVDRAVSCWGGNRGGQVGRPADPMPIEAPVASMDARAVDVDGLALGGRATFNFEGFSCVWGEGLPLHCFGDNNLGQLGIGSRLPADTEIWQETTGLAGAILTVAAGDAHACAIEDTPIRRVLCWGSGSDGQLGNANTASQNAPVPVNGFGGG
ncbi:MAG: hypothetical protein SangKO_089240 [Sandaracinaceae bacterium]